MPKRALTEAAEYHTREWIGVALPLLIVTIAQQIQARGDVIVLGTFRSKAEVGLYAAAVTLAATMDQFASVINSIIGPGFAELHAQRRFHELQTLLTRGARLVFAATPPMGVAFIFLGTTLLQLFGKQFPQAGIGPLSLLVLAQLVASFTGSVGLLLSMTGWHSAFAATLVVTGILNLAFDLILIPGYGAMGAAAAGLLAALVRAGVLSVLAVMRTGATPTAVGPLLARVLGGTMLTEQRADS